MQQQRHKPPTDEFCPNCGADNREYWSAGTPPPFCMTCRFPLLLIAGKYRLIQELNEGGCGTVYEARHTQLSRDPKRAIKIIKPELMKREGMKARFSREVQVTGSLSQQNQHIVRIYDDFGQEPGLGYYYIMEFLKGDSVDELLMMHGSKLPLDMALHLFTQLCDAMQDAHAEEIIHRDLKPENLFVVPKRRDPHFLKVIDFGIAKPIGNDQNATKLTGGALGTPAYMSPEQCTNSQIDARTDIYAMGCILFELIAGFPPFSAQTMGGRDLNLVELLTFHMTQPAPDVLDFVPPGKEVPEDLADVIMKAMAKEPDKRYRSIEALEEAFKEACDSDTSTTIRPSAFLDTTPPPQPTIGYDQPARKMSTPMPGELVKEAHTEPEIKEGFDTLMGQKTGPKRWLWLLLLLLPLGSFAIWLGQQPSQTKKSDAKVQLDKTQVRPKARANQGVPQPTRPTALRIKRVAPGIVPPRRIQHKRKPLKPRKRMAVLIPTRLPPPPRRRVDKGRQISQCPHTPGVYWIKITMSQTLLQQLKRKPSSNRIITTRRTWGLCVGAKDKRATLTLANEELYYACRFRIWGRKRSTYRLQMAKEEGFAPYTDQATDYCLK